MLRDLGFRDIKEFFEELLNPLHRDDPRRVTTDDVASSARAGRGVMAHFTRALRRPLLRLRQRRYAERIATMSRSLPPDASDLVREVSGILDRADTLLTTSSGDPSEESEHLHEADAILRKVPPLLSRIDDAVLRHRLLSP